MIHLVRVPVLPLGSVNAFVLCQGCNAVIVDAGLPGTTGKFVDVLRQLGRTPSEVRLIVLTHGHIDHIGSAVSLRELTGAPIVGHEADRGFFGGIGPRLFRPTGWFGSLFLRTGAMQGKYPAFEPDIVLRDSDELDLTPFGVAARVIATPGHTPGSLTVVWDHEAIVGDLISSGILLGGVCRTSRAKPPPFEDDATQVGNHLHRLLERGTKRFHMGHGGPLPDTEVQRYCDTRSRATI